MKRPIIIFTVLVLLITACTPAAPYTPHTGPMPLVSKPTISQFESTPLTSEQSTAQPESSPTGQAQPAVTKKSKAQKSQSGTPSVDKTRKSKNPLPAPTSTNPDFVATEIAGRPTDNSITINLVPATGMEIYYEYGTTSGAYTTRTTPQSATAGMPLETLIDGLQPNTRYYYHLVYNGTAGAEHTFVTQRAPGNTFVFDIQGDSHPERAGKQFGAELYTKTLLSAASDQPDFYIAMGDDFSVDALKTVTRETVTAQYLNQRHWLGLVGAPVFLVNGNHEQASLANLDGSAENVAVWAQAARNAYYPQPAPDAFYTGNPEPVEHIGLLRNYYAWEWGDALFLVIDPYWHSPQTVDNQFGAERDQKKNRNLWNVTLGETQYRWFRQTLETSPAKYKFVFAHHVNGTGRGGIELASSFEWGDSANLAAYRPGWDKTIHQIMVDSGVTIFFQGHDHIFVKQQLDGVIYQTLPEPANPFYTYENESAYLTGDKFPNSGRLRVTVSPSGVTVDYIRSYLDQPDEIAFSYAVPPTYPGTEAVTSVTSSPGSTSTSSATQKSPRGTKAPGAGRVQGQAKDQGSDASQNLSFEIPPHSFDTILGRPTAASITLSLLSTTDQTLTITYGAENAAPQSVSATLTAKTPQEITLTGLAPDTQYFYSVNGGAPQSFHTARAPGATFTFTVQADSHLDSNTDPHVYAQTLANQRADQPDFVIDLGDTFMTDKYKPYTDAAQQYLTQRYFLGQIGQTAPLFLVLGNHDGEGAPRGEDGIEMSVWSGQLRTKYFPNPMPDGFYTGNTIPYPTIGLLQDYYAWEWGAALFIVLDPYWFAPPTKEDAADLWNPTLGKGQYQWLKTTLETSQAKWKFVFTHQLIGGLEKNGRGGAEVAHLYEWGGEDADGAYGFDAQRPGWGLPIHQLLVANHVNTVFHGHDHLFVKQELDGIIYQEVPQPGAARPNGTDSAAEYGYLTGDVLGSPGHIRVTVSPDGIAVEYVRSYLPQEEKDGQRNGQVDYTYTIPAP